MDRAEKRDFVSEMKTTLEGAGSIVVAQYTGLTVAE
ncbi:MAG: 50S ribosomal protein L10, partial [Pseudomonadota bacterium]